MDEMRARMRDRRLQRRARDARDAPPPPPDARGEDPPAGPGSNHDHDDFSASDADAALPSRAPRGFGADTTARAGSAIVDAFSPHDDDRAETETAASYDAALRGLEADRRALREEVLRVRRVDAEREEAASFERARRLELEREVAQLRGGGDERATSAEAEEGERGDDDSSAEVKRLERALAEERRARKTDAELRGELETVAARLAEAVALADETDRAARREMGEALSAARRDARRAAEAETEALRLERRAEDAEARCAKLLERARLAESRLENGLAAVSVADDEVTKTKTKDEKVTDGVERDVSDNAEAALSTLRAELVGVREDLKRETTLAKSALRDLDEANRARDEAMSLLRQKERELESLKESLKAAKAEETAILDAAREEASRDLKRRDDEVAEARASSDDARARLADALLDLDEVSLEKKRLAEALALEARETRDARDEAERLARQLADERESSRRRLREARDLADAREAKHRLEQAEWEDAARLKRRERYAGETRASFSAGGPDRDPTGRDPTVPRARTGEGADGGDGDGGGGGGDGDGGGGDASKPEDARRDADRAPVPPRSERGSRSRDDVRRAGSNPREGEGEEKRRGPSSSLADPDRPPPRARPAYAPNGFPLPAAEASAPVSFAPPSSSARGPERTVPVPVPVPGPSEYDRYLESLPPSPIAGPPPPPPPGRMRGRGDAREEPAPRFWRERPVRSR
jgi:hypothetical protein